MEVQEDGRFFGYMRIEGTFTPRPGMIVYRIPLSLMQGTLFLPVVIREAWVSNFDPNALIWSSPFKDAVEFGPAAPQFTSMRVLNPQVGDRILVLNSHTDTPGWIDAGGVGSISLEEGRRLARR